MNVLPDEVNQQDPKPLITSTIAAERFGFTNDYISLLCRQKKITGSFVGRMWYVEPESLQTFLQEAKQKQEQKRVALSTQLKREYEKSQSVPAPSSEMLRYEILSSPPTPSLPVLPVKPRPLGVSLFARQALALSAAMALIISGTVYATEGELPLVVEFKASYQKAISALPELSSVLSTLNLQKSANTAALSLAPIQNFFCTRFNFFCPDEEATGTLALEAPAPPAESSMIYHTEREDSTQSTDSSIYGTTPASPTG